MAAKKKVGLRSDCSRYLARTLLYQERGDIEKAKIWATALQNRLIECGLLVASPHIAGYDGRQSTETPETAPKRG